MEALILPQIISSISDPGVDGRELLQGSIHRHGG